MPSQALHTAAFHSSQAIFSVKFLTHFRFALIVFATKQFSEKSRQPSSQIFRPCPLRCRRRFSPGVFSFLVILRRKRPFIFNGFFFGGSHTLFETAGNKFRPNPSSRFGAAWPQSFDDADGRVSFPRSLTNLQAFPGYSPYTVVFD